VREFGGQLRHTYQDAARWIASKVAGHFGIEGCIHTSCEDENIVDIFLLEHDVSSLDRQVLLNIIKNDPSIGLIPLKRT
jgi:hypothetical protein